MKLYLLFLYCFFVFVFYSSNLRAELVWAQILDEIDEVQTFNCLCVEFGKILEKWNQLQWITQSSVVLRHHLLQTSSTGFMPCGNYIWRLEAKSSSLRLMSPFQFYMCNALLFMKVKLLFLIYLHMSSK